MKKERKMIERFIRWMIKTFLPGFTLSRIGKRAKKEKEVSNAE